jgi:c-di-AMP phosphodiesterase-like protein
MRLICINDKPDILHHINSGLTTLNLTYGKEYQILCKLTNQSNGRQYISLVNDRGIKNDYLSDRFVSLEKFREIQLNKIGISDGCD